MTDEDKIIQLYKDMYKAMIDKNRSELERVHDDSFALIHMTGMRQSKKVYIASILDGTLNYYSALHEDMQVQVLGDTSKLIGKSKVNAAVFGGGEHTWRLLLDLTLIKRNGDWYFTMARASTY